MADDTERLIVFLEAKIDTFEKNLAKAARTADSSFKSVEQRSKRMADTMTANMQKAAAGVTNVFSGIGRNFLGAAGVSGLGLTALVATAVKLNGELAKIPGLAREAGVSTDKIQEIKFAANVKGLGDEDFIAGMRTSLGLLDEAQRNVNTLSRLFNANGLSIKDQNGDLIKFDSLLEQAARLMAGARTEQEKIKIAEMLGLSRDWVRVLRDGPEAFKKAAAEAHSAGVVIDQQTVQRAKDFDRAWTEAITRFKAGLIDGLADLSGAFAYFWRDVMDSVPGGTFIRNAVSRWAGGLSGMTLPELEAALQRSVEQGVGKIEVARIQAEIDKRLGNEPLKINVEAEVVGSTVVPREKQDNSFNSAVFEANKRIAALDAETNSIGLNTASRERAKLVAQLEEAAKKANTDAGFQNAIVTDKQREKIEQLADAMEAAAKRQANSHEALKRFAVDGRDFVKQFDQLAISAFGNVETSLASMVMGTKSAQEAFAEMTQSILADLIKIGIRMAITAPLAAALGGAMGGGVGMPMNILPLSHSGRGPGDRFTQFRAVPRFHTGVGPSEMPAIIRKDESVLTPGQMRALGDRIGGGGGGAVSVVINGVIPADTKATAASSRDGAGNQRIDIFLQRQMDDTAAGLLASGESSMNRSLERRYGLTPRL